MTRAYATIDHQRIKSWVQQRGGHPAVVAETGDNGVLKIDFNPPDEKLAEVDWDTFFETFDRKSLAFLYQDKTASGEPSRFSKFIDRSSTEANDLEQGPEEDVEEAQ
ncbi:MAG TPA: hypothetical protein VHL14_02125 [Steroidobacteraceae bacterium]|nr:hypothetical protein [Steroidobacteraceae bacterium]